MQEYCLDVVDILIEESNSQGPVGDHPDSVQSEIDPTGPDQPEAAQLSADQPTDEVVQVEADGLTAESSPELTAESVEIPPEVAALSQAGRDLLTASQEVFKDFHPEAGALNDLPQLTIQAKDTALVCSLAKEDPRLRMRQLLCLACVDYQDYLQLVYFLHSLETDNTLVLKTSVTVDNPLVPSITGVWQAGEWYEREAHDLFGVEFEGHPGLTPLLLYEGFEGYPGRKDFPFNEYQEY